MFHRRWSILVGCLVLFILAACVTPEEYDKGQNLYAQGRLEEAYNAFSIALSKASTPEDKSKIQASLDAVRRQLAERAISQAQSIYESKKPPTLTNARAAADALRPGLQWDGPEQVIAKRLAQYEQVAQQLEKNARDLAGQASTMADRGHYEAAWKAINEALKIDPTNPALLESRERVLAQLKSFLAEKLDAALKVGDWENVQILTKKLADLDPNHPAVIGAQEQIRLRAREDLKNKAQVLTQAGRWYNAYLMIQRSGLADEMGDTLAWIRNEGARYYLEKSRLAMQDGNMYGAYVAAVKAKEFAPQDGGVFEQHRITEDAVDNSLRQYIAVAAFDNPTNDPDAGKQFSDDLISYLFRLLPYGIGIVERQKIDLALQEKAGDVQEVGNLLGVNMIIIGNVSLLKVDEKKTERTGSAKVRVGTEQVTNPEYYRMLELYGNDVSKWPSHPPRMLDRDRFEWVRYHKGQGTMNGFINVAVRIFNVGDGTILYTNVFKNRLSFEDKYSDPVPEASPAVQDDPLELPTTTEVKEKLKESVITKIAEVVMKHFRNREKKFLASAKYYVDRRQPQMALESLAKAHVYAKRAKLPADDPSVVQLNQMILSITE